MDTLITTTFLTAFIGGIVMAGIPLLLAGLGEQISEKSGILNLGLEGMMLAGAYGGFAGAFYTQSIWLGFLIGGLCGAVVAALMAILCVCAGLNQIVVGIALVFGFQGLTALLFYAEFRTTYPRLEKAETLGIPGLADLPVIGPSVFDQQPLVYIALLLVAFFTWLYARTNIGNNLQAAGDRPAALDAAGVNVYATRTWAVISTGALAGLGGAFMSEVSAGTFVPFMTKGAGFIAIVLAMLARGRPGWVLLGALLFGVALSLSTAFQVAGVPVPTEAAEMLPFAVVIVMLVIFARRAYLPAALGRAYKRGGVV